MWQIKLFKHNQLIKTYKLNKPLLTIGQSPQTDICLQEDGILKLEAHILFLNQQYTLKSLSKGIVVNQKKVKEHILKDKDEIKIGSYLLKVEMARKQEGTRPRFEVLARIGRIFNEIYNPQEILNRIIDLALEITGAERGFVMLYEKELLKVKVARNINPEDKQEKNISQTIISQVVKEGKPVLISSTERNQTFKRTKSMIEYRIKAILCVPLKQREKELKGVIYLDSRFKPGIFKEEEIDLMVSLADFASIAIERAEMMEKEKALLKKTAQLEAEAKYSRELKKLKEENRRLQAEISGHQFEQIIGSSLQMQKVYQWIRKLAGTEVTILIEGETGTGKELVARAIHNHSGRKNEPFIVINCGAIPENLLESELFGYEEGAFTGAVSQKKGKFEIAGKGTIFLDEVGELSLNLQVKFLRVLQERYFERIGGTELIPFQARILAATNKKLEEEKNKGNFREDLFFRLNTFTISLPPLRERGEDIIILANFFLRKFADEFKKTIKGFTPEAKKSLVSYNWPGNVRELENKIKKAVLLADDEYLSFENLELPYLGPTFTLKEARKLWEGNFIKESLTKNSWNLSRTAAELGIDRGTLREMIERYKIKK
jgi:Nif-specific regulatory protein